MIGLRRGTVKLDSYNPKWKVSFEKEKRHIHKSLGDLIVGVEHVGSTAIPGALAKPVIDIAVVVKSIKFPYKLIKLLGTLGYEYKKDDDVPGRLFFIKGSEKRRTHYIHVVKLQGREWKKLILFRNYLLAHNKAIHEYNELKNKLAKQYTLDRKSYTSWKDKFIKAIIKKAQNE